MIRCALILGCLLAAEAAAQIKLYALENGTQEREITGSSYSVGSSGPGDVLSTRFRVRNIGTTQVLIRTVSIAGTGFEVTRPSLPFTLAPNGTPMEVTVRFSALGTGGYSANLTIDTVSVLVLASVVNAVAVSVDGNTIAAGLSISLGSTQKGTRITKALLLENRASDPLRVQRLTVTGSAFAYRGPAAPFEIAPLSSERIEIDFTPPASQNYTGQLAIDGRTFPLTGGGFDPPLPRPSIVIEGGGTSSGQQAKVSVRLASPAGSAVNGVLRMTFQPLNADLPDDPAIRMMTGRAVNVQTRDGEQRVFLAGSAVDETFATGTTAGTITWTLELGTYTETQALTIPAAAVVLDTSNALRRVQDLDISLTGFDNTRSISQAFFTFYDAAGRPLAPGTIRADVKQDFADFFKGSTATGGVFTMRASFPVQGGAASQVAGVDVEIVNSAGGTRTQRLTFAGN